MADKRRRLPTLVEVVQWWNAADARDRATFLEFTRTDKPAKPKAEKGKGKTKAEAEVKS